MNERALSKALKKQLRGLVVAEAEAGLDVMAALGDRIASDRNDIAPDEAK